MALVAAKCASGAGLFAAVSVSGPGESGLYQQLPASGSLCVR